MSPAAALAAAATLALFSLLAAIGTVDLRRMVIPDALNLALAAAGASYWLLAAPEQLPLQLCGAAAAFALFWLVRSAHWRWTGRLGLGLGDVKMAGAGAVWIAPLLLPNVLLVASASALAFALGRFGLAGPAVAEQRMPFGPFLGLGFAATWVLQQWMEMPA